VAARYADDCLSKGDTEGCEVWKGILKAIEEWVRVKLVHGERAH
jgi:hypothetical protein